jgi:hypothetical protein
MSMESEIAGMAWYEEPPTDPEVGWKLKISFKKLGKTLNKLRKNPLLKGAVFAAATAFGGPAGAAAAQALGMSPLTLKGAKAGAAALLVEKRAKAGDKKAQALLAAADAPPAANDNAVVDTSALTGGCPVCGCVCRGAQ